MTLDAIAPVQFVLGQLREVVDALGDDQYTRDPVATFSGSIGGHVRHCLDHINALVQGAEAGSVDYDHRERGTDVETDRAASIAEIDRLIAALKSLEGMEAKDVAVKVMLSGDGVESTFSTTVGRELVFMLSHTIHHGAMIGGMVQAMGGKAPVGFGVAPSTLAYRKR